MAGMKRVLVVLAFLGAGCVTPAPRGFFQAALHAVLEKFTWSSKDPRFQ